MEIKISQYGSLLIFQNGFTPEFVFETIHEKNLNGLRIFSVLKDEKLENLDFLKDYTFLEALDITSALDYDFSFLEALKKLKIFSISTEGTNTIDLSNQLNLERLVIHWRPGQILGIENCQKLVELLLIDFKEPDFLPIQKLKNLKKLEVKTSTIKTLTGLEKLSIVENLLLGNCRSLKSVKALNGNINLKSIIFNQCTHIEDYDSLMNLPAIESLEFIDCKEIKSINFIHNLNSLKKLVIIGNTNILDGDLKPAQKVEEVIYTHRKHYNVKIENKEQDARMKRNLEKIKDIRNRHK